jgi:photosystem II stability/assembly factor-like uncharacterized protein
MVGSWLDNGLSGAVWVFTRSNGVWTQQGPKLTFASPYPYALDYLPVALSGDGSTAVVGRPSEAFIFTRSNGVWTQTRRLTATTDSPYGPGLGTSVSIRSAGNLAVVGGPKDWEDVGAAFMFQGAGSVWNQQGPKLRSPDGYYNTRQGSSVAMSSDGSTVAVGGLLDGTWIYVYVNGSWRQQARLWEPGHSVALSGNGNTAAVSNNFFDDGGVRVFTRSNGVWRRQESKLFVPGGTGFAAPVAISANGNTIVAGGPGDRVVSGISGSGAAWVFEAQPLAANPLLNWTRVNVPVGVPGGVTRDGIDRNLEAAAYGTFQSGGSTFAIAGKGGNIITYNGSTVTNHSGAATGFNGIAFSDTGAAVAVGDNGWIYRSTNGTQWSGQQLNSKQFKGVTFGGGVMIAVQAGGRIFRSMDSGQTWQESLNAGQPWSTQDLNAAAFGGDKFVVTGNNSEVLFSSDAGLTWTRVAPAWDNPVTNLQGVAFGEGWFVAAGENGAVYSSNDLEHWTFQFVGTGTAQPLYGIAFGSAAGQNHFVAVGKERTILVGTVKPFELEPEPEGPEGTNIEWTQSGFPAAVLKGIAFGNGRFVAAGYGATIIESSLLPW